MKKAYRSILAGLLFLGVLSAFFFFLINDIKSDHNMRMSKNEIESSDLSSILVPLTSEISEWYPGRLYTPEDFAKGTPTVGENSVMYGTYRVTLKIPKGKTYGITGVTCSYSQRVYINGVLLSEVGNVSDNSEDFVPRTDSFSVFFTPETDETEIITQLAHFNNKNGYYNGAYLGEQNLVVAANRENFLASGLIVGTLIAFAVFFFGVFLFYPAKRHILCFSIGCFLMGVYFLIFQNKDIMALLPDLPWAISHKTEYLCQFGSHIAIIVFTVLMLGVKFNKWIIWSFCILQGVIALYFIIAPSTFYSYYDVAPIAVYSLTLVAATVIIIWDAIKRKSFRYKESVIVIFCLLIDIGTYIFDVILTSRNFNVTPFATILIIFFEAVAITIQFSRTEKELNLALLREKEIAETNTMIARMSRLKSDFLHTVAHEMKTPLTIISGFAQVADWQLQDGTVDKSTSNNLKSICDEATRLSAMVERLSEFSFDNELTPPKGKVDVAELLRYCSSLCEPVTKKNDNHLDSVCENDLYIYANRDAVLQVLFNLIVNANKHTKKGMIRIKAKESDGFATFTVEDNGNGIARAVTRYFQERYQRR